MKSPTSSPNQSPEDSVPTVSPVDNGSPSSGAGTPTQMPMDQSPTSSSVDSNSLQEVDAGGEDPTIAASTSPGDTSGNGAVIGALAGSIILLIGGLLYSRQRLKKSEDGFEKLDYEPGSQTDEGPSGDSASELSVEPLS